MRAITAPAVCAASRGFNEERWSVTVQVLAQQGAVPGLVQVEARATVVLGQEHPLRRPPSGPPVVQRHIPFALRAVAAGQLRGPQSPPRGGEHGTPVAQSENTPPCPSYTVTGGPGSYWPVSGLNTGSPGREILTVSVRIFLSTISLTTPKVSPSFTGTLMRSSIGIGADRLSG
ncbi:hypothetical protein JCM4814A_04380 [Streptomyces phaeofaciens JCM 4814]|uniref:Uncharacterized protein n=1 Tax=Streptomyces phaeofaciens TaxID=68254 RepID=A0A918LUK9_9ACTN|nr:hypothetical protein GCM10010226_36130 [Streptomyces phaeofaciens]